MREYKKLENHDLSTYRGLKKKKDSQDGREVTRDDSHALITRRQGAAPKASTQVGENAVSAGAATILTVVFVLLGALLLKAVFGA